MWRGLNDTFRNYFIQITTKTRPHIKEILDNFFTASERYMHAQKASEITGVDPKVKNRVSKLTSNFAVNSNHTRIKNCVLCSKLDDKISNHPLYKCEKFSTPKAKVEKIKSLNGCTKCASLDHKTDECKFLFKRKCNSCSLWHFNFLCIKTPRNSEEKRPKEQEAVTNRGVGHGRAGLIP